MSKLVFRQQYNQSRLRKDIKTVISSTKPNKYPIWSFHIQPQLPPFNNHSQGDKIELTDSKSGLKYWIQTYLCGCKKKKKSYSTYHVSYVIYCIRFICSLLCYFFTDMFLQLTPKEITHRR